MESSAKMIASERLDDVPGPPDDPFAALSAAFAQIPDSAAIYSADGEVMVWNAGARELFGYTIEEMRQLDISVLCPPEDSGDTLKLFARALSAQPVEPRLVERVRKDGTRVRVSVRVSPLENADGKIFGVLFMARDLTTEEEREKRLSEVELRERDIATLVPDALYIHRDGKILWANPASVKMFGAQSLTDFVGRMAWDLIVPEDLPRVMDGHRKLGDAAESRPIFVRRRRLDGEEFPSEGHGARIVWEGEPATLMVVRDLSEHERTASALVESEERVRNFANISPDGVLVHIDGDIVFANKAATELFGAKTPDDLVGLHNADLVTPEDWVRITESLANNVAVSGSDFMQVEQVRLDGSTFTGQGRTKSIVWEGKVAFLVAIRDVTEQLAKETELREAEARQRDFAAISPDAMLVHVDGEIVFVNESALQMFHAESEADLVGRPVMETIHPEDRSVLQENIDNAVGSRIEDFFEARRVRLDGTSFLGEGRFRSVNWKGTDGILVVIRDITEKVAAQDAMLEAEDRYRQIVDISPNAILVHVEDEIVLANRAAATMLGADSEHDLIGRRMLDFVPKHARGRALERRAMVGVDGRVPFEPLLRCRLDGTEFMADVTGSQYFWGGAPAILTIMRDVG